MGKNWIARESSAKVKASLGCGQKKGEWYGKVPYGYQKSGKTIFFKLQDIEIPYINPYEIQTATLHVIYEGQEMRTESRK